MKIETDVGGILARAFAIAETQLQLGTFGIIKYAMHGAIATFLVVIVNPVVLVIEAWLIPLLLR